MKTRVLLMMILVLCMKLIMAEPVLTWRFANPMVIPGDTFQFDVQLKCSEPGTYHSSTQIYFEYNMAAFGPTIVESNRIVYEKLELLNEYAFGNPKYKIVNDADNTLDRYAIVFEANFVVPNPMFISEVTTEFKGFIRFRIAIMNPGQTAGIHFVSAVGNTGLMDFGQFYVNSSHPAETPYGYPPDYEGIYANNLDNFVLTTGYQLDLKVILEGPEVNGIMQSNLNASAFLPLNQPYSGNPWLYTGTESVTSIPGPEIVDWVLLELRDAGTATQATSSTTFRRSAVFLCTDGSIKNIDGSGLPIFTENVSQNLYVVIHHRNHLSVMSALPPALTGNTYTYDFASGSGQVYGGPAGYKEINPGQWGMISGDGNADGQVSNPDKLVVWKAQVGQSGYKNGDFNLDGSVGNPDKIIFWTPNVGKSCQVP